MDELTGKDYQPITIKDIPKDLTKGMRKKHILFGWHLFSTDNKTQAAVLSGHAEHSSANQGYRLARREDVQRIAQWLGEHAIQNSGLVPEYVIDKLKGIVEQGTAQLPIKGPGGVDTGQYRMADASSAVRALELLGRYMSLWQGDTTVDVRQQVAVLGGASTGEVDWQVMVDKYLGGNGGAKPPSG